MALNLNFSAKGAWVKIGPEVYIFVQITERGIQLLIDAPKHLYIERHCDPPEKFAHLNPRKDPYTID